MKKPSVDVIGRVVGELSDLTVKIESLRAFLSDGSGQSIDYVSRGLLCDQLEVMVKYQQILLKRLTTWRVF